MSRVSSLRSFTKPATYLAIIVGLGLIVLGLQLILLGLTPNGPRDLYLNAQMIGALVGLLVGAYIFFREGNYQLSEALWSLLGTAYLGIIFAPIYLYIMILCVVYG